MDALDGAAAALFKETELLIDFVCPNTLSNSKRRDVDSFVKETLRRTFPTGICIGSTGSFPLRSYLPESDLDLVIVSDGGSPNEAAQVLTVFDALCRSIVESDLGHGRDFAFVIRNVEFRNARTKLAHCVVNNLDVDITVNQTNAMGSNLLLEEADRAIGEDHIFKKSLLLLKAWCAHETSKYCGVPILGSKDGMFSSYALSVMVLYIFKNDLAQRKELRHPFLVFRRFLDFYSSFQWSRYVLTLDGPVPITNGSHKADSQLPAHDRGGRCDAFEAIITRIRERGGHLSKAPMMSSPFPLRGCNIVDPINGANNLGFNVTKDCLERIDVALKGGHHHLETLVRMINHARQPLQVAPALSLSYDPSGSSMSAFNMPPSTNGGVTYASHFLSTNGGNSGPPPVTTNSTRPRAESVGGIAMHSSLGEIDGSYGVKSAGVGSEYLTVFFAQCRARYMLNSGCRHDLLDHPKQKGSFFGQMGRPESGSSSSSLRPGSAPTEGSGSETQPRYCDDATDPLSGNIADMWGIYLKANESMRRAADVKNTAITSQKHTFSVLSPTSDLTEVAKYDVDHLDNSSSSESHGVESSKDYDEIKRNVALSASPTGAPEQTNATLSKESYVLSSLCTRREKDSHNPANLSSDATIDERVLGSPDTGPLVTKQRKGSKSRSKTTEEIQIDRKPDIGAQQSVVLDSKQMLTPPIPISEVDAPTVSPVAQNIVVEVETVAVQTHDDWKKDMYQTDEYVSFFSNNRMNAVAAICTLLIFIVAAYALGKSSSDLASRGTALTGARGAIGADTGDNESATSVVSAAAEDNCSVEVNLLLKYLESSTPQPARSLALSTLEQWTTKGSNISIAASDHLARAYVELNGCYAQSSKCVNMVSLRPATGTDESIDRSDTCHNYSARSQHVINFAWHRHGDHNPSTVCQRGPCTLSVFNIQSKDEGQYDLIMSKWNMLSTTSDVDVIVSSLIIRVSEPPISSSKAVYLTLGMGASLYLHIKAEGVPEPSLQWYKNGFVLPGQNRPVLHIHSVNKFDEGTYTCELRNIAGTYVWQEGAVSVRSVVPPPLPARHN